MHVFCNFETIKNHGFYVCWHVSFDTWKLTCDFVFDANWGVFVFRCKKKLITKRNEFREFLLFLYKKKENPLQSPPFTWTCRSILPTATIKEHAWVSRILCDIRDKRLVSDYKSITKSHELFYWLTVTLRVKAVNMVFALNECIFDVLLCERKVVFSTV